VADVPGGENGDGTEMLIPFVREGERRRLENKPGVRDITDDLGNCLLPPALLLARITISCYVLTNKLASYNGGRLEICFNDVCNRLLGSGASASGYCKIYYIINSMRIKFRFLCEPLFPPSRVCNASR
jgi:hypothetical protein